MNLTKRNPRIYLISGKANSGKDTITKFIHEYYSKHNKRCIDLKYASYIKEYTKEITDWDGSEETKPRTFLQQLGTEIIREQIDPLFLVNRIIEDIKVYSYFYDIITVSDVRTQDEINMPKKIFDQVTTIRINRLGINNNLTEQEQHHFTEVALDDYHDFDHIINNDGSLDDLQKKTYEVLEEVK